MNYDLLLRWLSERGEGSLTAFRTAHDWLASDDATAGRWTWTVQSLQSLGHLQVDWQRRRWEVAPSTIATLMGGGGYALLCGARPGWFLRRLADLDADRSLADVAQSVVLERPVPQPGGPSLRLVTLSEEEDASTVCKRLGVEYSPFAADRLLALLPSLAAMLRAGRRTGADALPGGVIPARMGTGGPGPLFEEVKDPLQTTPGAYRATLFDTARYFYVHNSGDVFEAGRGEVIFAELRRQRRQVLRWEQGKRSLLVPGRFRLPALYERAAVLRTGLLPETASVTGPQRRPLLLRYRNVDYSFARTLADRLGQELTIISPTADSEANVPVRSGHHRVAAASRKQAGLVGAWQGPSFPAGQRGRRDGGQP